MAVDPHGWPDYNHNIPFGNMTPLLFAVREGDLESELPVAGRGL